jgi:hypothetical protein
MAISDVASNFRRTLPGVECAEVWGLGFMVRVWGLGFRVWGLGFRVPLPGVECAERGAGGTAGVGTGIHRVRCGRRILARPPVFRARIVAAQVEFESNTSKRFIMFMFQALSSRRFQLGFDKVNLHRPTGFWRDPLCLLPAVATAASGTASYLSVVGVGRRRAGDRPARLAPTTGQGSVDNGLKTSDGWRSIQQNEGWQVC